ncbi:MAG TPA: hypothetical protein VJI46_00895 [Candidatus Nanoarchaeia archaeon]|nr:hypothetical protein [Candidatus Nanoarchaeia archaeon]
MKTKLIAVAFLAILLAVPFAASDRKDILPGEKEIPATYDETLELIGLTHNPNRYLMWTFDGANVMWGIYRNGYFVGNDNYGKKAWGVYGTNPVIMKSSPSIVPRFDTFKGYYEEKGNLFEGTIKGANWEAKNLFNRKVSSGRFITFKPIPMPEPKPLPDPIVVSNTK